MASLTPDDQIDLATAMERLAQSEAQLKALQERLAAANQSIAELESLLKVTQKNLRITSDALKGRP